MYTVAELIEALKQCPQDYEIALIESDGNDTYLKAVGIDNDAKTVDLFAS
jgi:hypothetical protein